MAVTARPKLNAQKQRADWDLGRAREVRGAALEQPPVAAHQQPLRRARGDVVLVAGVQRGPAALRLRFAKPSY